MDVSETMTMMSVQILILILMIISFFKHSVQKTLNMMILMNYVTALSPTVSYK